MYIPHRYARFAPTQNPWFYRPYEIPPECNHTVWVMGFNYECGDSETCTHKAFRTMREALPHLQHVLSADMAGDFAPTRAMQSYINGEFAIGGYCNTPMLPYHWLIGQLEEAVVEYYDEIEIMFHSCGRSRPLLPMLADEPELDGVQPLECPPTGAIDLLEIKRAYGTRLCLMGNLNTPELMLRGSADDVYHESVRLLDGCKQGGAFMLSTGDQCGRDTPDENIHAMRRACRDHGSY